MSKNDLKLSKNHQQQIAVRKQARHYAVQAIYQWRMAGASPAAIEAEFRADYDMTKVDEEFFHDLLTGVAGDFENLQLQLADAIDRQVDDLDVVELALLTSGAYELAAHIEVPYKVVINEYVNLAKKFGATDSYKYVNGVLDKLAGSLRPIEIARQS
ncbi:MAG: transcription antitermination factor NusB [Pseudomonadales bacterium]